MRTPDLAVVAARYALGLMPSWELPGVADALIDQGRVNPAIAELATLRQPTMTDAGPLLERVLQEQGVVLPSREDALWAVLRHEIDGLARGAARPEHALGRVMEAVDSCRLHFTSQIYVGDSHGLEHLVGAYWDYDHLNEMAGEGRLENGDEARRKLDGDVVTFARAWMALYQNAHRDDPAGHAGGPQAADDR